MSRVGPDDVRLAARWCRETLEPFVDRDWGVPAGSLEWDCRTTVGHIADALGFFTAHLGGREREWLKFDVVPHADASNLHVARLVAAMGEVLAQVMETTPENVRAFHHSGMWDKWTFAAMGCLEALVHTGDVAAGLRIDVEAPQELCRRVLERLFVGAPKDEAPWVVLWWATGRGELPGRAPVGPDWGAYWLRVASEQEPPP